MPKLTFSVRPALLLGLLLTACTGTPNDDLVPVRLIVADAGGLRVVTTGATPGLSAPVAGTQGALVVRTLSGGQQVAVLFPDRVEVRDAQQDSLPVVRTLPTPTDFTLPTPAPLAPCYTRMGIDAGRTRLALLSACSNQTQAAAFINTRTGVAWSQTLPAPGSDPAYTFVALTGPEGSEQLTAVRRAPSGNTEVLRADRDNAFGAVAFTTGPLNDAAVFLGRVYAASIVDPLGVREIEATKLGAPLNGIQSRSDRLYSDANLLISYDDSAKTLTFTDSGNRKAVAINTYSVPDVTVAPDGFAYALTDYGSGANTITRYDTVLGLNGRPFDPTSLVGGLQGARSITWSVAQ